MSSSIAVQCISNSDKIVSQTTLNVPSTATIADLKKAMGKTVQVLINGAVPSETTLISDLAAAYGSANGELRVNYSVESSFGASTGCAVCTPLGGGSQWASM